MWSWGLSAQKFYIYCVLVYTWSEQQPPLDYWVLSWLCWVSSFNFEQVDDTKLNLIIGTLQINKFNTANLKQTSKQSIQPSDAFPMRGYDQGMIMRGKGESRTQCILPEILGNLEPSCIHVTSTMYCNFNSSLSCQSDIKHILMYKKE